MDIAPIRSYFSRGNEDKLSSINASIDNERDWLMTNSDPKAVLSLSSSPSKEEKLWNQANLVATAVVTLGEKPENRVNELFVSGRMERGLVLDTLASSLVEFCAEQIYEKIVAIAGEKEMVYTGRIIPGGADFDVSYQKKLFDLVDLTPIGVTVTSKLMMKPIKSTSFLTLIGKNVDSQLGCNHCDGCDRRNKCEYREFGIFQ